MTNLLPALLILALLLVVSCAASHEPSGGSAGGVAATPPATRPGSPEAIKLFVLQKMFAQPFCFTGVQFPRCDFENPQQVRELMGPYTISTTYYDSRRHRLDRAEGLGRYAAVVDIHWAQGKASRRFLTLARINDPGASSGDKLAWLAAAGIDPTVAKTHIGEIDQAMRFIDLMQRRQRHEPATMPGMHPVDPAVLTQRPEGAILVAGLFDLTEMTKAASELPPDPVSYLDRQWWVDFRRGFLGYDQVYSKPFVCPVPSDGPPAPVVHEGTLAEAGMTDNAVETIDAACQAWVADMNIGFNLCVVRHGVVVVNKGYGKQTHGPNPELPYTAQTAGPLASTTKFLSAILLAEFVDQGLVDLDEPFDRYVPTMRDAEVKRPMSVRDGYIHLGGFQDHWGDEMPDLEYILGDMYPALDVGVHFHYEGNSLALGGKIMENISGESIPHLYRKHLFNPLGCKDTQAQFTSYGSQSTPMDLARIGQMMLNGGAYGSLRFFRPETLAKLMPIPGNDRLDPADNTIRCGVGIKQFDIDGFDQRAFGHPGATGSCVVVDPGHDLVIAMTRFEEGGRFKDFLRKKSVIYKAVLDSMDHTRVTGANQ